jgi:subtilisin family serine protease
MGTSQAAPHVSGEVAILRSQSGGLAKTPAQIVQLVANAGTLINDTYAKKNRIDIAKALAGTQTPPPSTGPTSILVQNANPINLTAGQSANLIVTAYDSAGNQTTLPPLTFTSTAPTYATVSSTGVVTGMAIGSAWINIDAGAAGGVEILVQVSDGRSGTNPPNCKTNPRACG